MKKTSSCELIYFLFFFIKKKEKKNNVQMIKWKYIMTNINTQETGYSVYGEL